MDELFFAESHLFRMRERTHQLRKLPFDTREVIALTRGVQGAVLLCRLRLHRHESVADAAISLALCTQAIVLGDECPAGWHQLRAEDARMARYLLRDLQRLAARLAVLTGSETEIRMVRDLFGQPLRS